MILKNNLINRIACKLNTLDINPYLYKYIQHAWLSFPCEASILMYYNDWLFGLSSVSYRTPCSRSHNLLSC